MSTTDATTDRNHANSDHRPDVHPARRVSTETKSSYKTTELIAYVFGVSES